MANFHKANLNDANLQEAILEATNLEGATLVGVNLTGAALLKTKLIKANLSRANLDSAGVGAVVFSDTQLTEARNLATCDHWGPSSLDYYTLAKSGTLPVQFLRGCGLPDTIIDYLPSLLSQPLEFYTCFISFTEADDDFSQRLYNDLQGRGMRCWRWKEDAKVGQPLMQSIDEAVRSYEKLIVICSKDSLRSPAVIREIERALQKEDALARQGKEPEVLIPIRIDDYIFDEWSHHRKADLLLKNIGDFTHWQDHNVYIHAFEHLCRTLMIGK